MAGLGSRFASAGYEKPKPFIDLVQLVVINYLKFNRFMCGGSDRKHGASYGFHGITFCFIKKGRRTTFFLHPHFLVRILSVFVCSNCPWLTKQNKVIKWD